MFTYNLLEGMRVNYLYLESEVSFRLTEDLDEWCLSVFLDRDRERERLLCLLRLLVLSRDLDLLLLLDFVMVTDLGFK